MDRVNLSNPFLSRSGNHEDRLTWAFLTVLKYDPFLQSFLRALVESRLHLELREWNNTWDPAHVLTQTARIDPSTRVLVSVLITNKSRQEKIPVKWSDRGARYDGVIEYSDSLTLILENKPDHRNVRKSQLSPSRRSLPAPDDIKLHQEAICLEWSEIMEGVLKYADSSIAPFSNQEIARDFLSFVEEIHPRLTPYRTFDLCGDNLKALKRRTTRLAAEIAGMLPNVEYREGYLYRHRRDIAERIHFRVHAPEGQPWRLRVSMWPASTATQANAFRQTVQRGAFLALKEQEWNVQPNLNFAFPMGKKLFWVSSPCGTQDYLDYFFSEPNRYAQKRKDELPHCINAWEEHGVIDSEGLNDIDRIHTDRPYLNVNPEFWVYRDWDRQTVMNWEDQEQLATNIIAALDAPPMTWGETL